MELCVGEVRRAFPKVLGRFASIVFKDGNCFRGRGEGGLWYVRDKLGRLRLGAVTCAYDM